MSLTATNKLDTNKYELTIKIDAESFEKAIEKAYKKNIKSINVPGFRRGKAPRRMVEKLYGEAVFFEDAINDLYPSALQDAIKEAGLEIVARPEVEAKEVNKETGVEFVAICIVKPEVKVKNYKGIKAEKFVSEVTDAQVDERIEGVRERNARLVDVERASKKGDTVVFDFEGFADGKAFEGGKAEDYSLELGSGQFIPGFEEQLEKRKIGDEFDVTVTFPEAYQEKSLAGKEAIFKCKLNGIKEKEIPALDDEFAKDVSEFDTLAEYKDSIRKSMQDAADKAAEDEMENTLIDKVIENMEAEIPEEMYESRIDEMMQDFDYRLQSQGMNLKTYMQYTGMNEESFRLTFKEQAEKQVKIRLALEAIVAAEKITPSEEELNAEYQRIADGYKMDVEEIKKVIPAEDFVKDTACNKAIDIVKSSAVITEKKAEEKKAAPKKTTAKKDAPKKEEGEEKKPAAKSTAAKKPAAKATTAKTTTAKKPAAKAATAKTTAAKKPAAKATTAKTTTAKKPAAKKADAE